MKVVLQVQMRNVFTVTLQAESNTWWKLKKFRGDDVLLSYSEHEILENNASLLKFTHMALFTYCLPI